MPNRRDFLKLMGISTLGMGGTVSVLNASGESDRYMGYKAIVYLYLGGGNDGLNTFPPLSTQPNRGFDTYYNIRNNIRIEKQVLSLPTSNGALDLSGGNPYAQNNSLVEGYTKGYYTIDDWELGINGLMPEIAHLATQGKVALFANMGNIVEPATKKELKSGAKKRPPFLFAHNHQEKLMLNGEAGLLDYSGWAGRVAEVMGDVNSGSVYGTNIAIGNTTHLFESKNASSLVISSGAPSQYRDLRKKALFSELIAAPKENDLSQAYANHRAHSFWVSDAIGKEWKDAESLDWSSKQNAYGGALFTMPSDAQLNQSQPVKAEEEILKPLKAVAKLIHIGKTNGLKRQIFYVGDSGYDTHSNQSHQHAKKLRSLSLGLGDFYKALEAMGMEKDVLILSASDFGRSTGNNGDGSDHAWGSNYFAIGGDIKGGVYGKLPDLTLGGPDDFTDKGRIVPTTAMTQYYATACRWFGLSEDELDLVFPDLKHFSDKRDLGFVS